MIVNFKVVVAVFNAEDWIERCMVSLMLQSYQNWKCVIVDDASKDKTLPRALAIASRDGRFEVIAQPHHQPSHLVNQCQAIDRLGSSPEDVIVILDGDDWLYDNNVLERLNKYYLRTQCWMTYGSFRIFEGEGKPLRPYDSLRAYPDDVVKNSSFRKAPWYASHLRTFKYGLWAKIDQRRSFYLNSGEIVPAAVDMATMFPMLEMAGNRSQFIQDPMVVYNLANPLNLAATRRKLGQLSEKEIRSKEPYGRIEHI
jgi:glycosyltransferase involved in cell wall biosynthesis